MRYVSLGDSSAVGVGAERGGGYPARLAARLRRAGLEVEHRNVGASGAMAVDVATTQAPQAARLQPALVTIGVGGNDLWQRTSVAELSRSLRDTLQALALVEHVDVFVLNVPDLSLAPIAALAGHYVQITPQQGAARVDAFNAAIADVVNRVDAEARATGADRHHVVVDLCGPSRREAVNNPELFASDGFHPSARGYERYTDLLWPAVVDALHRRGHVLAG
ncbi:MAG TPA: GDSL-type esterase/lipase family protein [Myxococcota bacterium]